MAHEQTAVPDLDQETFQTAFKFAPIGMAFLSLSGTWLRANRALCEILGRTEPDLLATTMEALLHPDDVEPVARYLQNIRDGAILGYQMEVRYRHPRGEPVWVLQSAALLRDAEGNPSSLLVQTQNITLRKQAEEALRESELKYKTLVEGMSEALMQVDNDDVIQFVNPQFCQLTGYGEDELLGRVGCEIYFDPDEQELIREKNRLRLEQVTDAYETRMRKKNGEEVLVRISGSPVTDARGQVTGSIGVITDITLRRQAEEALRESEEKFRILVQNQGEGIAMADLEERFTFANPAAEEIFGVPSGQLVGRTLKDFMNPEQYAEVLEQTQKRNFGEKSSYELEIVRPDGERRSLLVTACPRTDPQGKFLGTFGIFRDITLRKQAEEALQESEQRFRAIFDISNDGIVLADTEKRQFLIGNQTICQMLGYSPDEIKGLGVMDIHPPADLPYVIGQFEKQARREISVAKDLPVKRKDGSIFYADVSSFPITLAGKTYLVGAFRDTTLRKRVEEELIKLQKAVESAAEAIFVTDLNGIITYVNPAFTELYGHTYEDTVGKVTPRILKSGAMKDEDYKQFWQTLSDKKVVKGLLVNKTKDGRLVTIEGSANPILDDQGNIHGFLAVQRDITLRRQAEAERERLIAELKDALAKVKTLSGLLPICASCKKIRDDQGYWNQIDIYIRDRSEADFSHGICPDCAKRLYPDIYEKMMLRKENGGQS